ncbi:DUF559 domain-containing protein [Nocardia sp. NPDC058633]|uniref:DUF559 domain-containing protein n=1 Tax=Nocardia sp. NPDC058633 TaxID=3346568 RepID=UPI00366796C3
MDYGIRTRAQLLAAGVPAGTIDDRCRRGVYTRVLPRTYSLGPPTAMTRCVAVTEWLPGAHLSHRTAAWLWGMVPEPSVLEATVPKAASRRTPTWLRLYRRDLPESAFDRESDLPTVTAAQALLDCVAVLPGGEADRLVDSHIGRSVSRSALVEVCGSGRHGAPAMRRQLVGAAVKWASEPERLFARAMARRNLHLLPNHPVGPYFGDFVDERTRTIVEIDGWEFHTDRLVFRNDRRRQNWLQRRGWLVLRYAAYDVLNHLESCVDEVEAVVRPRRARSRQAHTSRRIRRDSDGGRCL